MNFFILLISAIIVACSASNCINGNAYLAYLYKCQPEEFQELLMCVGSGELTRNRLGLRLACQNKKRIIVSFSAIEHVDSSIAMCDRQPVTAPSKLDECSVECKLDSVAGQCDGRVKCNPKLEEFLCLDPNIENSNNETSLPNKEFVIRIQYICVDEPQRLEYMNEINYNSESICQQSTTSTRPSPLIIPDVITTHLIADGLMDIVLTQQTVIDSIDESEGEKGNNASSFYAFNDVAWTAAFLSNNIEKWVLYLLLGLLVGLVLVLLLLLCLCCTYSKSSNKQNVIFRPNSQSRNVKQTRGSQTLADSGSNAPRMIRFKRDEALENPQSPASLNFKPVGSSNTHEPINTSVNRSSSGVSSSSTRKSMGWNRASDAPSSWPAPPNDQEEHSVYPKTPYPPAVVIANNNASRNTFPHKSQPILNNENNRKSLLNNPARNSANNLNMRMPDNRFVDRDSVFTRENEPLLSPTNQPQPFPLLNNTGPRQQPQEHVWQRNSVLEGPEGINFYPSVSTSPIRGSIK